MSNLQPHQQRVVNERDDLQDRIEKLVAFIDASPIFRTVGEEEQVRLLHQQDYMGNYLNVLNLRIAAFK